MRVDVDETGGHVEAGRLDLVACASAREIGRDGGDLAAGDGHVHHRVDAVFRIDDVAVPDQQIELGALLERHGRRGARQDQEEE